MQQMEFNRVIPDKEFGQQLLEIFGRRSDPVRVDEQVHYGSENQDFWVSRWSVRSFAGIAHSSACSTLLALLPRSTVRICLPAPLTHFRVHEKVNDSCLDFMLF